MTHEIGPLWEEFCEHRWRYQEETEHCTVLKCDLCGAVKWVRKIKTLDKKTTE